MAPFPVDFVDIGDFFIISAKNEIYRRFLQYIGENRVLSAKKRLYQRNPSFSFQFETVPFFC